MAKPNNLRTGFPCVICGEPRTSNSKANKFRLCHECYTEIRKGVRPNKVIYQSACEVCGITIARNGTIPACASCRSKYYHHKKLRKELDKQLIDNSFTNNRISLAKIIELGYEVIIKPKQKIEVIA